MWPRNIIVLLCTSCLLLVAGTGCTSGRKAAGKTKTSRETKGSHASDVRAKYAAKLSVKPSELKNARLYAFVDSWSGTPYRYGGGSKSGVDCSGFVGILYKEVYSRSLPRTTRDLSSKGAKVPKAGLREGDLVFFNIKGKNSHVGVYLANGYFVHASTSRGVIISHLENSYYKKVFSKGGRV